MSRLVVVSNRVAKATDGKDRAGGLAVALQDALKKLGGVWFGWSGSVVAKQQDKPEIVQAGPVTYATLDLTRKQYNEYYNGFANRTLWPLFHYRLDLAAFSQQNYSSYREVNTLFASKLKPLLKNDDLIWVHDYHLIPLGEELRRAGVTQPMGFFLHTPFPAMEVMTVLPSNLDLVRALCAYDVVGFQTENDLRAFLDYIVNEAGGGIMGNHLVHAFGNTLRVEIFPIGIDVEELEKTAQEVGRGKGSRRMRIKPSNRTWIVGVDRLDYSKGLVQRFQSFERFLESHPAYRGAVTLVQIAPPSRSEVIEYRDIRHTLEGEAGRINGRFGEFDWVPINYLSKSYTRIELVGFYQASRIGLVTPLRDGMNLVAKEYVAAQNPEDPGVLVLSRFAGAARELEGALTVNPYDADGVADALAIALKMTIEERLERWNAMMDVMRANNVTVWRDNFIETLRGAPYKV